MRLPTPLIGFFFLVLLEIVAQTYLAAYVSKDIAAITYLLVGIGVGTYPLFFNWRHRTLTLPSEGMSKWWGWFAFSLVSISILYFGWRAVQAQPLDYTFADMLPIIQIMGERWLAGEAVYEIIPEIWGGMQPIYLPVMWLVYVPAIILDVDMRVINLLMLVLVSALVLEPWRKSTWQTLFLRLTLLLTLLVYVLYFYSTFITISEEPVVVGFYVALAYAVLREHRLLLIIALTSCFLSRYTLIFWVIVYFGYLLWQHNRRQTLWVMLGTGTLVVILLILSQGIYQLELFISLKDDYLDSFQDPDLAWRTQNTVSKNIGIARFLAFDHLIYLHRALFWVSLALPVLLFTWYHIRRLAVPLAIFAICSLKLCLVYFFNFNALPYSYLFYTSTFLSVLLFSQLLNFQYNLHSN
ncbi:MAG: hypothetical protein AAFZ63_20875 [Bacteroidota bacterium]